MSVATRPRASSPLSPPKSLGLGPSFHQTQEEELAKVVEQDPMLEELCKPLCCKLCNVTLNSAQQAQAHYQVRRTARDKAFRTAACAVCVDVPVPVPVLLVTLLWEHRVKCGLMHREHLSCSRPEKWYPDGMNEKAGAHNFPLLKSVFHLHTHPIKQIF